MFLALAYVKVEDVVQAFDELMATEYFKEAYDEDDGDILDEKTMKSAMKLPSKTSSTLNVVIPPPPTKRRKYVDFDKRIFMIVGNYSGYQTKTHFSKCIASSLNVVSKVSPKPILSRKAQL